MNLSIFMGFFLTSAKRDDLQATAYAWSEEGQLVDRVGGQDRAIERKIALNRLFRGSLKPMDFEPREMVFPEELRSMFFRSPRVMWEGHGYRNFSQDRLYNICFREIPKGGEPFAQLDAAVDKAGCVLHTVMRELRMVNGASTQVEDHILFPGLKVSPMSEVISDDIAHDFFDVVKEGIAIKLLDFVVDSFAGRDIDKSL